jgi:hypothetical protein
MRPDSRHFPTSAAVLLGWGIFNVVEGLVDHQLLGLHHVNETAPIEQWLYSGPRLPRLGRGDGRRRLGAP